MIDELSFVRIEQEEFQEIDYVVMGMAYELQNEMGRIFNEHIYRNELKYRLADKFETVNTEVPIPISFDTFSKVFSADLVINARVIYELKVVPSLVPQHSCQLLQYLHIANLKHGKLINFGADKVEGKFVSTQLSSERRRQLEFHFDNFLQEGASSERFKAIVTGILSEWGGFLGTELLYEAICHFLDLGESVIQAVDVISNDRIIGTQKAHMLSDGVAFKITALCQNITCYRNELKRFLTHTTLSCIQWVNMNHHDIHFETIQR